MKMNQRIIKHFIFLLLLIASAACQPDQLQTSTVDIPRVHIRLPMGYIPSVQYAPFYVAHSRGYFEQAGIDLEFDYQFETDGVALVGANDLQFALVSGEQVLLARNQGLPVVYVFAWWQDYPVAVASFTEQGIRKPADLAGKKIGLPGLFGANYVGLRALLDVAGLSESDVQLDSIGFTQVDALIAGVDDSVAIYANNEPIQLKNQGYSVDVIRVADYVDLASNGLLTNEITIKENPELVERMVGAILKGLADTMADPDAAFEICKKYIEVWDQENEALYKEILLASMEFWKSDQPGISQPQTWENMQKVLLEMGWLAKPLDLNQAYTNRFVPGN